MLVFQTKAPTRKKLILSSAERDIPQSPPHTGHKSQPSTPGLLSRKRSHESTPSPQRQPDKMFDSQDQGEWTPPARRQGKDISSPSPRTPEAQLSPGREKHMETDDGPTLREAQDQRLRRLVEEEEGEEKDAQDHVLHDEEDEARATAAELSEDASRDKSEKEVDVVGSGFLCVVLDAMKSTGEGDGVDKTMLLAQNLDMRVE